MKGYKLFNKDFTCKGFRFAENTEYKHEGSFKICNSGFHFCQKLSDCFSYYPFDQSTIVCEVEALGGTETHSDDSKACTNHIRIGKRLTWAEVLFLANEGKDNTGHSNSGDSNSGDSNSGYRNSGDMNSGYRNSGDMNSGYRNSGYRNSGHSNSGDSNSGDRNSGYRNSGDSNSGYRNSGNWNSGDRNSGDMNSGYRNSGAFCTDSDPKAILFNKVSSMTVKQWEQSKACNLMYSIDPNVWIYSNMMSEEEKKANPKHETTDGYLKSIPLKEAWANAWGNWSEENRQVFKGIENFDADIFFEITGIKVE